MIGSLDHLTRQLIVHTSPTKRSNDFIAHLEQLDQSLWPPARTSHETSRAGPGTMDRSMSASSPLPPSKAAQALASPSSGCQNTRPNSTDIEVVWRDLKAHNLAHYTFTDAADLDRAIHQAVQSAPQRAISPPIRWSIRRSQPRFLGAVVPFIFGRGIRDSGARHFGSGLVGGEHPVGSSAASISLRLPDVDLGNQPVGAFDSAIETCNL